MSQTIVLKNGEAKQEFIVKDGSVEVAANGDFVIDYHELMKAIHEWSERMYSFDAYA